MIKTIIGSKFIQAGTNEKVKIIRVWKKSSPVGMRVMFDLLHLKKDLHGNDYIESVDLEQLKTYFKPL